MVFVGIILSILSLMYGYITFRLTKMLSLSPWEVYLLWGWLGICWLSSPIPIYFRVTNMESKLVDFVSWFTYINLGLFSTLLVILLFHDIGVLSFKAVHLLFDFSFPKTSIGQFFGLAKTRVAIICGLALLITVIGYFKATTIPNVKHVQIPVANLPSNLEKLKLVQISDIHIGPTIKKAFLEGVVKKINGLNPDIAFFTGDLVDGSVGYLKDDVEPLKDIKATYGSYFVTGNHEYYSGVKSWINKIEELGFKVLDHQYALIEHEGSRLLVAGVPDFSGDHISSGHISNPSKIPINDKNTNVKILLAHQPKSIYQANEAGFDIQLSGHTHAGQCFPWNLVAKWTNGYLEGLHKHDKTWIYVSAGTGYWGPPLRFGTTQEITLIQLIKESIN